MPASPLPKATTVPSVSVVVPWWDHTEFLPIWEHNLQHFPAGTEVIFIDNGSAPEGEQALREFCQRYGIKLIRNATNLGFSAANNQGLAIATGDYILHLNNDIQILQLPLAELCAAAGEGLAGPGTLTNELDRPYLPGWALCVRRTTLVALGGWNEEYGPGYWDDVDLSHRAELAGYSLTAIPQLSQMIHHQRNVTGRDGRLDQLALHQTNRRKFIRRHYTTIPKILIDGILFLFEENRLTRLWQHLLAEWRQSGFAQYLVLLDRGRTANVTGMRCRTIEAYDESQAAQERQTLQDLCDEEGAQVLISSYYTAPLTTPSVFLCYDMASQVLGTTLNDPMESTKQAGIEQSSACICLSASTATELAQAYPNLNPSSITVAPCGVSDQFQVAPPEAIQAFRTHHGLHRPYILIEPDGGYQTLTAFCQALTHLLQQQSLDLVYTGDPSGLPKELRQFSDRCTVHHLQPQSEAELSLAYSSALALVYLAYYEGLGTPILEAMASGCPVITCPAATIQELAGSAVRYVAPTDVEGLITALQEIQIPSVRQHYIDQGLVQVKPFSWSVTAQKVAHALIQTTLLPLNLRAINLLVCPDWTHLEESAAELAEAIAPLLHHPQRDQMTILLETSQADSEAPQLLLMSVTMQLMLAEQLDLSQGPEISFSGTLGPIQWQVLLPQLTARLTLGYEDQRLIQAIGADTLPTWSPTASFNSFGSL